MFTKTEVEVILSHCRYDDWSFRLTEKGDGFLVQVCFLAPDTSDPTVASGKEYREIEWRGRKWYISPHMTRTEIVQTAFKAVLVAVEHEAREMFRYCGQAVFNTHIDIDVLHSVANETVFRG